MRRSKRLLWRWRCAAITTTRRRALRLVELNATSRMLTEVTRVPVPPNKAVVGANAFAHEAGIHQDGISSKIR